MNCSPHPTWFPMFLPQPVMKRTGRQGQQNLSFSTWTRACPGNSLVLSSNISVVPEHAVYSVISPALSFNAAKHPHFQQPRVHVGWIQDFGVDQYILGKHLQLQQNTWLQQTCCPKDQATALLVRSQMSNLGDIQHWNTVTTSACPASSQRIRGEQQVQHFSQQHKPCTIVRRIADYKSTPTK